MMSPEVKSMQGFGVSLAKLELTLRSFDKTIATAGERLRNLNDFFVARNSEAQDWAKVAVTDKMVYSFMEKTLLNYSAARETLEAAHVDYLLNEWTPEDEQEQSEG